MRTLSLLREAVWDAILQKVPSLLLLIVAASGAIAVTLTAGQQASQRALLMDQLNSPEARTIIIREKTGLITPAVLGLAKNTSGVEASLGVVGVHDVEPKIAGLKIPAWEVSDVSAIVQSASRPEPGEAVVDQNLIGKLNWETGAGVLEDAEGRQFPVVGAGYVVAREQFANALYVQAPPDAGSYAELHVTVDHPENLGQVKMAVLSYLSASGTDQISVQTAGLEILQSLNDGEFSAISKGILGTVVAASSFMTAVVSLSYVLLYRRLLGRRRALGITRFDLGSLISVRIALPVAAGSLVGCVLSAIGARLWFHPVPLAYIGATAVVIVLSSVACSVIPVGWAVRRDPARVLRTP